MNPICECGKMCYDKRGAQTARNALIRRGREQYLRIYQCETGDVWHITKQHHFSPEARKFDEQYQ